MFEQFAAGGGMGGATPFAGMGGMGGMPHMHMNSMGNMGGMSGFGLQQQDPPVEYDLPVSYEELLYGTNKKMKITRDNNGPGNSMEPEQKILEISVKKGWKEGTKITFPKEGNRVVGKTPADIVFKIKDKPHKRFTRDRDNNLICREPVSLKQALIGHQLVVKTLTGHEVPLDLKQITPTTKRLIKGEGLPLPKTPDRRGDLIVEFDINFPRNLSQQQKDGIGQILPD